MQCKKCGNEFEAGASVTECPFCGAPVNEAANNQNLKQFRNDNEFEVALKYIFDTFGADEFDKGTALADHFKQVAPGMVKHQRLLDMVIKSGVRNNFIDVADALSVKAAVKSSIKTLEEDFFLAKKIATTLSEAIAYAHGFNLKEEEENKVDEVAREAISNLILSASSVDDVCEAMKFAEKRKVSVSAVKDVVDKVFMKFFYEVDNIRDAFAIMEDMRVHSEEVFHDGKISPNVENTFISIIKRFIFNAGDIEKVFEISSILNEYNVINTFKGALRNEISRVLSTVDNINDLLSITGKMRENNIDFSDYGEVINERISKIISSVNNVNDLVAVTENLSSNNIDLSNYSDAFYKRLSSVINSVTGVNDLFTIAEKLGGMGIDFTPCSNDFKQRLTRLIASIDNIRDLATITDKLSTNKIELNIGSSLVPILKNCIKGITYSDDLLEIADYARNADIYNEISGDLSAFVNEQISMTDDVDSLRTLIEYVESNDLCTVDKSVVAAKINSFILGADNADAVFEASKLASECECSDKTDESVNNVLLGFVSAATDIRVLNDIYNKIVEFGVKGDITNVVVDKLTSMLDKIDRISDLSLIFNFMNDNDLSNEVYVAATVKRFLNSCSNEDDLAEVISFAYKNDIFDSIQSDASRCAGKLITKSKTIDEIKSYLIFVQTNNLNYNFDLAVKAALNQMVDKAESLDDIRVVNDYIKEAGWLESLVSTIKERTYDAFTEVDMTGNIEELLEKMYKIFEEGKYSYIRENIVSAKICSKLNDLIANSTSREAIERYRNFAEENNFNLDDTDAYAEAAAQFDVNAEVGNMYYNDSTEDVCSFISELQNLSAMNNYFASNDISMEDEDVKKAVGDKVKEFLTLAADIYEVEGIKSFVAANCPNCGFEADIRETVCRLIENAVSISDFLDLVTEIRNNNSDLNMEAEITEKVNRFFDNASGIDDMLNMINEMSKCDMGIDLTAEAEAAVKKLINDADDISTLGLIVRTARDFTYFENTDGIEDAAKHRICRFIFRQGNLKGIVETINIAKSKGMDYDLSEDISAYISKILSGTVDMESLINNFNIVKNYHICSSPEDLAVDAVSKFIMQSGDISTLVAINKQAKDHKINVDAAVTEKLKDLLDNCVDIDDVDKLVKEAEKNKIPIRNESFFTNKLREFADNARDLTELTTLKKYLRLTNDFPGKEDTTEAINYKIGLLISSVNPVAVDGIVNLLKDDRDFTNLHDLLSKGIRNYYDRLCRVNDEEDADRVIDKLRKDVSIFERKVQLLNNGVKDEKYDLYILIANICNTKIYEFNSGNFKYASAEEEAPAAPAPAKTEAAAVSQPSAPAEQEEKPAPVTAGSYTIPEPEVMEEEPEDPIGKILYEIKRMDINKENNIGNAAARMESILDRLSEFKDGGASSKNNKFKNKKGTGESSSIEEPVNLIAKKMWALINIPKYHIEFADYVSTRNYIATCMEKIEELKCCTCEEYNRLKKFAADVENLSDIKLNYKKRIKDFKKWQSYYEENRNNDSEQLTLNMYEAFTKDDAMKEAIYTSGGSGSKNIGMLKGLLGRK